MTARRGDRLDQLAAELRSLDADLEVLTIAADLADPATPERLVAETIARFGGLDVLINNAGLACRLCSPAPSPSTWLASSRSISPPRSC